MYSKLIGTSKTHFVNWLIPEEINENEFQLRVTASMEHRQTRNRNFDEVMAEKLRKFSPVEPYKAAVLCSIYRSDSHLVDFLTNLLGQDNFNEIQPCIVVCDPSDFEVKVLTRFVEAFTNCQLHIFKERVGIYTAWNQGLRMSTAPLITNMNVDDSRRHDSLFRQIQMLNEFKFIDVAYQDVLVSLKPHVPWETLADVSPKSKLPPVSFAGLLAGINPPHNAPMWRRELHDKFGVFQERWNTAGDFEFWVRCALQGVLFMKDREAHVSYYINPKGLSTSTSSVGAKEMSEIQEMYLNQDFGAHDFDSTLAQMANFGIESEGITLTALIKLREMKALRDA